MLELALFRYDLASWPSCASLTSLVLVPCGSCALLKRPPPSPPVVDGRTMLAKVISDTFGLEHDDLAGGSMRAKGYEDMSFVVAVALKFSVGS